MGYMTAIGTCLGCKKVMAFNPQKVPSLKGEPICKYCVTLANAKRKELGLEPHHIHPEAYEAEEV